jgi:hypothetical protein
MPWNNETVMHRFERQLGNEAAMHREYDTISNEEVMQQNREAVGNEAILCICSWTVRQWGMREFCSGPRDSGTMRRFYSMTLRQWGNEGVIQWNC